MSFFQMIRSMVEQARSTIAQQATKATELQNELQEVATRVPQAWIGDDANEFSADFARRVVPAMVELAVAITGINVNLGRCIEIIDAADAQLRARVAGLTERFNRIV